MEERYSAEEENRMKSHFLSTMSHEIRTPMNAIIGMTDVALREEMSDEVKKCVTIIKSSSMGLLEIVNDILDLSKIEAGKLNIITDVYLTKSLVEDMEAIIDARNIDHKVPIFYHVSGDLPPVLEPLKLTIDEAKKRRKKFVCARFLKTRIRRLLRLQWMQLPV